MSLLKGLLYFLTTLCITSCGIQDNRTPGSSEVGGAALFQSIDETPLSEKPIPNWYQIKSKGTNHCLKINRDASAGPKGLAMTRACKNTENEFFFFSDMGGSYKIINRQKSKCLTHKSWKNADGSLAINVFEDWCARNNRSKEILNFLLICSFSCIPCTSVSVCLH